MNAFRIADLFHREAELLLIHWPVVPFYLILHERDTFAKCRSGNDGMRLATAFLTRIDGINHFFSVMAVHFMYIPSKRTPFLRQGRQVQYILGIAQGLLAVQVDDEKQICELMMRSKHCCFPDNTLIAFCIACQNKDPAR